ncbi:UNVERIFIED_CONTAM: hypothetical protein NY100_28740, partial [Prevotella sp. 15_C9]
SSNAPKTPIYNPKKTKKKTKAQTSHNNMLISSGSITQTLKNKYSIKTNKKTEITINIYIS